MANKNDEMGRNKTNPQNDNLGNQKSPSGTLSTGGTEGGRGGQGNTSQGQGGNFNQGITSGNQGQSGNQGDAINKDRQMNRDTQGSGGTSMGRAPVTVKGTRPT